MNSCQDIVYHEMFRPMLLCIFLRRCVVVWASFVVAFLFLLHFLARHIIGRRTFARGKRGLAIFFIRTLGARKKRGWCFGGRRERVDADFEL